MKLYLKHLFRSIGKRPLQPVILVLTLTLSILVTFAALCLNHMLVEEVDIGQKEMYGTANITVSLSADSESRFMFASRAEELLADCAEVVGTYHLPMFLGEDKSTVFGVATDLYDIGSIFTIEFTDYRDVYASDLSSVAFISSEFADSYGLSLGDTFTAEVIGEDVSYVVHGISDRRLLGSYDVMVDIGGVMRILAKDSLILSAIRDSFRPSSTLYVEVKDGYEINDVMTILSSSDDFSDKDIADVSETKKNEALTEELDIVIDMVIILTGVLAAVVTYCCFYILSMERSEENTVFISAGAKPLDIALMQFLEIGAYWIMGVVLATLLCQPLIYFVHSYIGFNYTGFACAPKMLIFSYFIVLAVALVTVGVFIISSRMKNRGKHKRARYLYLIPVPVLCISAYIVTFSVNIKDTMLPGIITMLMSLLCVFLISPTVEGVLLTKIGIAFDKRAHKTKSASLLYAVKNTSRLGLLHNFTRLSSLLLIIIIVASFVVSGAHCNLEFSKAMFNGDYIVAGATERCYQKVRESDVAQKIDRIYFANVTQGETHTHALSAGDISSLSSGFDISVLPKENKAAISKSQAKLYGLEIGDSFEVEIGGKTLELELSEICNTGKSIVIFDCEYFDISPNMILTSAKDGVSDSELLADLTSRTASELATVVSVEDLLLEKLRSVGTYFNTGDLLICVLIIFAIFGLFNNLYECYRSRKEEFLLYSYAGMKRKTITRMKCAEVIISSVYSIVAALLVGALIITDVNRAMNSLAYDGIQNILWFFRSYF